MVLGFAYDLLAVGADPAGIAGGLVPSFAGQESVVLAAGIVGATVMPHVIYLHSALTKSRNRCHDDASKRRLMRYHRIDVVVALGIAGLVNLHDGVHRRVGVRGHRPAGRRRHRRRPS